jgi:transcriptional regulator with XRE-family HTH domain
MKRLKPHWTEDHTADFMFRIGADFVAQVEEKLAASDLRQKDLAKDLQLTASRVSQIINNPGNLTLQTMIEYARALGMKLSVVLYDDGDSQNRSGPIHADIFRACWEKAGSPTSFLAISEAEANQVVTAQIKEYAELSMKDKQHKSMIVDDPNPWLGVGASGGYYG